MKTMKRYLLLILLFVSAAAANGQSLPSAVPKRQPLRSYESVVTRDAISYRGFFTVHAVRDSFFLEIPDSIFKRDFQFIRQYVRTSAPADKNSPTTGIP